MSNVIRNIFAILGLVILALVLITLASEIFWARGINPVALTRHAVEQCERVESKVLSGINNGTLPTDLKVAFGSMVKQSETFAEGYIKMSEDERPTILDAWKRPLQMMVRSNLLTLPNISPTLLSKTNAVIIWSSGPNGRNEFGNGDDVFLLLPAAKK
jgi:hypothetical protein